MVVLRCDASDALATTECNYIKTIGTTYEDSVSESMSISSEVSYQMQIKMFGIMESMGISQTTGEINKTDKA